MLTLLLSDWQASRHVKPQPTETVFGD